MRYNENKLRRIIREAIDEFAPEKKQTVTDAGIYECAMRLKQCAEACLKKLPQPKANGKSYYSDPDPKGFNKAGKDLAWLCVSIKNNVDEIISEYGLKEPKKPERGW